MSKTNTGNPAAVLSSDADEARQAALDHGLTEGEFARILELLGRTPNLAEIGVFSAMWSEHCSYKSSRRWLRTFPTEGAQILIGPGENAGVLDIGNGQALIFKIESHNHPSFIEPFQGAATGVGGILRDIFTMGARPLALLNSLRFGSLDEPRNRYLLEGVVAGISAYGNCIGVPTVGGEVAFDPSYSGNPLVNVFCIGLVAGDEIFLGRASGVGNIVVYAGSKTGRDGIHGATMASETFEADAGERRPAVQVGDPFTEKLLLEACLEAMQQGLLVGIQDMGAAGLTCSSVEMADRSGSGIEIDVARVPQREAEMTPYELLLSESQERMLLVVEPANLERLQAVFDVWDLEAAPIGRVTDDGAMRVLRDGQPVVSIPVHTLASEAPFYDRPAERPDWQDRVQTFDSCEVAEPSDYSRALLELLASPDLCDKAWVYRQYDHMVRSNTALAPGGDAAVLRIPGSQRAFAISVDGNGRLCYLDPYGGAVAAVAEAARNVVCVGARPMAVTNCLNFGNPERPEIMWQLREAIRGIGDACRAFETPVTGGNVSLYNETRGEAVYPTPVIGMVGVIEDSATLCSLSFKAAGDHLMLLGSHALSLAASTYLAVIHGRAAGVPAAVDLAAERRLHEVILSALAQGLLHSAHDCSDGGLAVAVAEGCFEHGLGAELQLPDTPRPEAILFGEAGGRIIVSVAPKDRGRLAELAQRHGAPCQDIGKIGGKAVRMHAGDRRNLIDRTVDELRQAWSAPLPGMFAHGAAH